MDGTRKIMNEAQQTTASNRLARMKAHPGDNLLTFGHIITGGVFIGWGGIKRTPAISTMHRSPAVGRGDNEGG